MVALVEQRMEFLKPAFVGDTLHARTRCLERRGKRAADGRVEIVDPALEFRRGEQYWKAGTSICCAAVRGMTRGSRGMTKPGYSDEREAAFDWSEALDDLGWVGQDDRRSRRDDRRPARRERQGGSHRNRVGWRRRRPNAALRSANLHRRALASQTCCGASALRRATASQSFFRAFRKSFAISSGRSAPARSYVPIFSGFWPDAVGYRLDHSGAKVRLVSTPIASRAGRAMA